MKYSFPFIIAIWLHVTACSSHHPDGWYAVSDDNEIEGTAIATIEDFAAVKFDSVSIPGNIFIEGSLKPEKIPEWTRASERRIGRRIGFVFRDSVVLAPTINCRLESGSFTIVASDPALLHHIYAKISDKTIRGNGSRKAIDNFLNRYREFLIQKKESNKHISKL